MEAKAVVAADHYNHLQTFQEGSLTYCQVGPSIIMEQIKSIQMAFFNIKFQSPSSDVIGKICELAQTIPPHTAYRIKNGFSLNHWDPLQNHSTINLPHTCTFASGENRTEVFIHLKEEIDEDRKRGTKIKSAVRLVFNTTADGMEITAEKEIKYSCYVDNENKRARVSNRIQNAKILKECPYHVPIHFWGHYKKEERSKIHIFSPRYQSDLLKVLRRQPTEKRLTERSMFKVCLDVCRGLLYLYKEGLVHKDIKSENVVFNCKTDSAGFYHVTEAALIDFEFCCPVADREQLTKDCGSMPFLSPERFLWHFRQSKPLSRLQEILGFTSEKDIENSMGMAMDLWSLGCIVHSYRYGQFPDCVYFLMSIEDCSDYYKKNELALENEIEKNNDLDELVQKRNELKIKMNELIEKYQNCIAKMASNSSTYDLNIDFFGALSNLLLKPKPSERIGIEELSNLLEEFAVKWRIK